MNLSLISIYVGGVLTLVMAVLHTRFFKLFQWKKEFEKVSEINAKVFYTIHLALLLLFFGIAVISLVYAKELSNCKGISLGLNIFLALFWLWRAVWQVVYFKPGKRGEFIFHMFLDMFVLLFMAYTLPVVLKLM